MSPDTTPADAVTEELLDWIEGGLARIAGAIVGLDDDQLRVVVTSSGWSIAGLVGHVHTSTHFWLHHVICGNPMDFDAADPSWTNDPPGPFTTLVERASRMTGDACAAVRGRSSVDPPGWWPEGAWGGYRQSTVRGVLLHVLNDNAAHTGHLDIVREQLDGGVWDHSRDRVRLPDRDAGRTST